MYQLTIIAATLGELHSILAKLEDQPAKVSGSTSGPATPVVTLVVPQVEPVLNAAQVFAQTPNVAEASVVTALPSATPAPVATVASPTPAGASELDPRGFPWDGRIHASTKTRLERGNFWKPLRGVKPEVVAAVEAELRGMGYGGGPAEEDRSAGPQTQVPPALPAAPVALPSVPVVTGPTAESVSGRFTAFIGNPAISDIKEDGVTLGRKAEWVKSVLTHYGVENMPALHSVTPEVIRAIDEYLTSVGM
jgi:hypothetical protein